MKLRFIPVLAGFLVVYSALSAYVGWNGWLLLSELTGWENPALYWTAVAILAFGYIAGRIGQSTPMKGIAEPLKLLGSYWLAILEYGLILCPIADLTGLLLKWGGASSEVYLSLVGGAAALLLLAILIAGSRNAWSPVIRTYHVQIPKSAGSKNKLTIAMASDLHLGTVIGKGHLKRLLRQIDEIRPDIVLLPGDILDDDLAPFLRKGMPAVLKRLKAPLGVFAVTGNHEYIGGKVPEFGAALDAIGIRLLMDEAAVIDNSFIVIGRKDKAAGERKRISELVEPLDSSLPLIMLDHQPSDLEAAEKNGIDLSLSGHTHRGQMAPNHLITRRIFELDWGYKKKGALHAIVSSGFGFWGPPIRIGSRSEVLKIEVEFKGAAPRSH
ncbi:metallophosphoesterase [Paenibacillus nanensis]|uniref:Metallophosphoesterase n=1 Tax=Paenibacillus nanensis TaxID=393251 RepID=A0A3A1UWX9_9BACL|nr:metallophosphoesterase [Paenibacillus nanensis]RIX53027.1 metallophosphoesterase [Paenibacillus nanensis]